MAVEPRPRQTATGKRARVKPGRPSYGDEQIERGLVAVAHSNGNTRLAARELAEGGLEIDQGTLWRWKTKQHVERYERIQAEVLPRIRARAAEQYMDASERQMKVAMQMTDRLAAEVDEIPARDLPGGIRNVVTGGAVAIDKAQLLNDQPTQRISIDLAGTLAELKKLGVEVIDGDAEEMSDDSSVVVLTADETGGDDGPDG